jgi:hypothetical protein
MICLNFLLTFKNLLHNFEAYQVKTEG